MYGSMLLLFRICVVPTDLTLETFTKFAEYKQVPSLSMCTVLMFIFISKGMMAVPYTTSPIGFSYVTFSGK